MLTALYRLQLLKAWEEEGSFKDNILQDKKISGYLDADELESLFDVKYHLGHIDTIIKRLDDLSDLILFVPWRITLEK